MHVFNGKRTILSDGEGRYAITSRPEAVGGYATPWDLCGENLLRDTLDYHQAKKISVTEVKFDAGSIPGTKHLDLLFATKWRNKVWLLPELDHSVKQFNVFDATGSLVSRYHDIVYETAGGVPYPTRAAFSTYKRQGNNTILHLESRLEVTSITTRRRDIPN